MVPKKKGRKPKSYYENLKLLELSNNLLPVNNEVNSILNGVINGVINSVTNIICTNSGTLTESATDICKNIIHKKRGRKPKGGKII